MKNTRKKLITMGIAAIGCMLMLMGTKAEAAQRVSKKTITVTLDEKHQGKVIYFKSKKAPEGGNFEKYRKFMDEYGVKLTVKVVEVQGKYKGKVKMIDHFNLYGDTGSGFDYPYNPKKLKNGTVLKSSGSDPDLYAGKNAFIADYPNRAKGVKKITYKITFESASGKNVIDYVKVKNAQKYSTSDGKDYYDNWENYHLEWKL